MNREWKNWRRSLVERREGEANRGWRGGREERRLTQRTEGEGG